VLPRRGDNATNARTLSRMQSRLAIILRDVQFWIPVIVLVVGLLVLRWIR
jgi:hypothetical protein